jgi:hypothetical protein
MQKVNNNQKKQVIIMKWTKSKVIGMITLLVISIGATAFTGIKSGWIMPEKEQLTDITKITDKLVVEYMDYGCKEKSFDTYVITKTEGIDGKKYMDMNLLSSMKREGDVLEEKQRGIEREIISKIMLTLLERKPKILEGSIETQAGTVEYYIREYDSDFTVFYITKDNKSIINFAGNKQTAWKLIEKIRDISMQVKPKSYRNSKQQSVEVIQTHARSGTGDVQQDKMLATNLQTLKEKISKRG